MNNDKFAKVMLKVTVIGLVVFVLGITTVIGGIEGLLFFLSFLILLPAVAMIVFHLLSKVLPDVWVKIAMIGLFVAICFYLKPSWYFLLAYVIFITFEITVVQLFKNWKWINIVELISLGGFFISLIFILDSIR